MCNVVGKDHTDFLCTRMSFQCDLKTSRLASLYSHGTQPDTLRQ